MGIKNMWIKGRETRERERKKEGKSKQTTPCHFNTPIQLFFGMYRFLKNLKLNGFLFC